MMTNSSITTKSGKTYEVRDGQLEMEGCYDQEVDAIIFKQEHRNTGPATFRIKGKLSKAFDGWITLDHAFEIAKEQNLPLGLV